MLIIYFLAGIIIGILISLFSFPIIFKIYINKKINEFTGGILK